MTDQDWAATLRDMADQRNEYAKRWRFAEQRADLAERRERELMEALQVHRSAMFDVLHPKMDGSERERIKDLLAKPAILAATDSDEPRAGQPPQGRGVSTCASCHGYSHQIDGPITHDADCVSSGQPPQTGGV